jgi:hypothetical protein
MAKKIYSQENSLLFTMLRLLVSVFILPFALWGLVACGTTVPTPTPDHQSDPDHPTRQTAAPDGSLWFSGYRWFVKDSESPTGPGPNWFSSDGRNVWVDAGGNLHLRITRREGRWQCAEVFTADTLGYGRYTFTLASRVDLLDKQVVLGLFTYADAPDYHHREIDIEFSQWGQGDIANAQYVVQPWENASNIHRFELTLNGPFSNHGFDWRAERVEFWSTHGRPSDTPAYEIAFWIADSDTLAIPPAGEEGRVHINLWLLNGRQPSNGQDAEVVVESFRFEPHPISTYSPAEGW